jgi:predicted patatin/cPLA2 family phospholipase
MEYIHTDHCNYNDFVIGYGHHAIIPHSWVCFQKNGCQYADGGFGDLNPILCAIENGACEIDVIILEEENRVRNNLIIKKSIQLTFQNIAIYEYSKWLKGSYYWKTSWIE